MRNGKFQFRVVRRNLSAHKCGHAEAREEKWPHWEQNKSVGKISTESVGESAMARACQKVCGRRSGNRARAGCVGEEPHQARRTRKDSGVPDCNRDSKRTSSCWGGIIAIE